MCNLFKYPRTLHLPWSPGSDSTDRILENIDHLIGMDVIVTEKLDGENTSLYPDHYHARSIDGRHHPSRSYVKQIHSAIKGQIPDGWRICGENMYGKHSIGYTELTSPFYVFSIWNEKNECLSWDDTVEYCEMLELEHVPVLYKGLFDKIEPWMFDLFIKDKSAYGPEREGYVVRNSELYKYDDFPYNIAKWVRKDHVQTGEHWLENWEPNKFICT